MESNSVFGLVLGMLVTMVVLWLPVIISKVVDRKNRYEQNFIKNEIKENERKIARLEDEKIKLRKKQIDDDYEGRKKQIDEQFAQEMELQQLKHKYQLEILDSVNDIAKSFAKILAKQIKIN